MKSAQQSMGKASEKLSEQKPGEAEEEQDEALEDLEDAFQQLEEEIEQMKQEIQEQQIAQLEAIFREMLEKQKKLTKDTADLDHRRQQAADDKLARADRVQLRNLSRDEKSLGKTAEEAETLLYDEGTSIVVLSVVSELKKALEDVGELMDASKTGAFVQSSQKEIELTLEELIEAMKQAQNQKQQQQQQQQQPPGEQPPPPLLPPAAELRMLKLSQLRVNRRTVDFDAAQVEAGQLDETMLRQAAELADFQAKVTTMAREISAMVQSQNPAEID